ncbi:MAG: hypothetical protein LIO96_12690, partial [Lachnospiraceae bacterium]|nr:hypothetical protein [Lachnospiraceae bacterium]
MSKTCIYCGSPLKEGAKFCMRCGKAVAAEPAQDDHRKDGAVKSQTAAASSKGSEQSKSYAASSGQGISQAGASGQGSNYAASSGQGSNYAAPSRQAAKASNRPAQAKGGRSSKDYSQRMGWYKFIIYVQLFLSAVVNVATAVMYMGGLHYGETEYASLVYGFFPGMKTLDMMMGIVALALAALCIVVRQGLKNFRKNAPLLYYCIWIINIAVSIVYIVGAARITGYEVRELMDSSSISSLCVAVVMLVINVIYFNNRKYMFDGSGGKAGSRQQASQQTAANQWEQAPQQTATNQWGQTQETASSQWEQPQQSAPDQWGQESQQQAANPWEQTSQSVAQPDITETRAQSFDKNDAYDDMDATSYLGDDLDGTVVLSGYQKPNPAYLIREKNQERIEITGYPFCVGKSRQSADYAITGNPAISRQHARFLLEGGQYM